MGDNFNKSEIDSILSDMHIIVDSRENKWYHIRDYFNKNKIPYTVEKLDVGDYSFILPNYPHLGLDKRFIVERKGSLSEVAGNFTSGRKRFTKMFERLDKDQKIHLVMETATWRKIFNGTYHSQFHPNSYKGSLLTYSIRYNCPVWFVEKKESPEIIYKLLHYELKEFLLNYK